MWATITAVLQIIHLIIEKWFEKDKELKQRKEDQIKDVKEAMSYEDPKTRASRISAVINAIRLRE